MYEKYKCYKISDSEQQYHDKVSTDRLLCKLHQVDATVCCKLPMWKYMLCHSPFWPRKNDRKPAQKPTQTELYAKQRQRYQSTIGHYTLFESSDVEN